MMLRRSLSAAMLISLAAPAMAQGPVPVEDEKAESALSEIEVAMTGGFTALTAAVTALGELIAQAITASGSSQSMATGQLLTAHAQELARWQTDLKDNTDPMVISTLPPNHCYVVTQQLAWAAATAARSEANSEMSHAMAGWTLGSAGFPTAAGANSAAASLAAQYVAQAKDPSGGVNSSTAQDLASRGVVVKSGDGGAAALHPEYLTEAMTLDDSEISGNGAWTQEMIAQLWDPAPPPMPDPSTAPPDRDADGVRVDVVGQAPARLASISAGRGNGRNRRAAICVSDQ